MRKLTIAAFVSVDGVMQGPGGPREDTDNGFTLGGWTVPYFDEAVGKAMDAIFSDPYDLLLGRRTYEIFANHWPKLEGQDELADQFGAINKYVATRNPGYTTSWKNSNVLKDDAIEAVRQLKAGEGRNLVTQGSAEFIQALLASDVVDEIHTLTFPVLLGKGKRLFGGHLAPSALTLISSVSSPSGVTINRYGVAGAVQTGSFALE
jgi:dihydrofolate reductase